MAVIGDIEIPFNSSYNFHINGMIKSTTLYPDLFNRQK